MPSPAFGGRFTLGITPSCSSPDTTDISSVEVVANLNGSSTICCRFIEGTVAKGCLIGFEGRSSSVKLVRTKNTLLAKSQALSNLTLVTDLESVFALDIESNGSTGALPIPAVRGSCSEPGDSEEPTSGMVHCYNILICLLNVVINRIIG